MSLLSAGALDSTSSPHLDSELDGKIAFLQAWWLLP